MVFRGWLLDSVKRKIILVLATGIGVGYFPLVPGTFGTLLAVPLSLGVNRLATSSLLLGLLTLPSLIGCAVWLSTRAEMLFGRKDPETIVIDESAGFIVANFLAPHGLMTLALAFILFRIFDIAKVFPASKLQTISGGMGIVLDDVIAGIYTFVILRVISLWGLI